MFKTLFYLGVIGAAAYGLFFAHVGGQTIAAHVTEVLSSDLVQKKIDGIKRDMRDDLEERLAKAKAEKSEKADKVTDPKTLTKQDGHDYVSEADRESLSALIEKKTKNR